MAENITVEANNIFTARREVTPSVTSPTGCLLAIVAEANEESAKTQVTGNIIMYSNMIMTKAIVDITIIMMLAATGQYYHTEGFQTCYRSHNS